MLLANALSRPRDHFNEDAREIAQSQIQIIDSTYELGPTIHISQFGTVYLGRNIRTNEYVAVKLEPAIANTPVMHENHLYALLKKVNGFPRLKSCSIEQGHIAMVMECLGSNLQDLHEYCGYRFSAKTVAMLADQILDRLEYLHRKKLIHRNIRPRHLVMGGGHNCWSVYLIDLSRTKVYSDRRTRLSTQVRNPHWVDDSITSRSSSWFASINAHRGVEQSYKDDLESLGYVLLYFLSGRLPWQSVQAPTTQKYYEMGCVMKTNMPPAVLFARYPHVFKRYMHYCRLLRDGQFPNYRYLRSLFRDYVDSIGKYDYIYDWNIPYIYR